MEINLFPSGTAIQVLHDTGQFCPLESIAEFKSKSQLYVVSGLFLMLYLKSSWTFHLANSDP